MDEAGTGLPGIGDDGTGSWTMGDADGTGLPRIGDAGTGPWTTGDADGTGPPKMGDASSDLAGRTSAEAVLAEAREAETDDHFAISASLAEAFQDDPVAGWACPDDARRGEVMRRFYAAFLPAMQRHRWTWTTPDLEGAAIWAPPGQWRTRLRDLPGIVRPFLRREILARLPRLGIGMAMVDDAHPREPDHFYLAVLGVSPRAQGRGLGSRLIRPTLEICDRDGVPAYLESSKESNIAFYARHGFRVTGELTLPRGPTVYKMWRDPA